MSNFKTLIGNFSKSNSKKLFNHLVILQLVFSLSFILGCADQSRKNYEESFETNQILGGEKVEASMQFADRVLYLAIGAKVQKTPGGGMTVSHTSQCTAFAISPTVIITAAHCVKDQKAEEVFVVLGTQPKKEKLNFNNWFQAASLITHPQYNSSIKIIDMKQASYDIAVIKLKKPLNAKHVSPIAKYENLSEHMGFTMLGYGLRDNADQLTDQQTKKALGELYFIVKTAEPFSENDFTILVDQKDGLGICSGDSGSPGYVYDSNTNKFYVAGILSGYAWTEGVQKKCVGIARYSSIIQPEIIKWINQTINGTTKVISAH